MGDSGTRCDLLGRIAGNGAWHRCYYCDLQPGERGPAVLATFGNAQQLVYLWGPSRNLYSLVYFRCVLARSKFPRRSA